MNYKKILSTIFIALSIDSFAQSAGSCIEIEGILINACSANEGLNEQVLFTTSNTPLTLSNLQVSWPNITNTWQGVCQNANTAALVEEMRTNLGTCGTLLEPVDGVIPANQQVLLFSGISPTVAGLSFAGLSDTLYVIFHCGTTTTGNFSNSGANPRTLIMGVNGAEICADTVTYIPDQAPSQDGAAALFSSAGVPDYTVLGCSFFTTPISAAWTAPGTLCTGANPINLYDLVAGSPFGTFSGQGVTNGIFNPAGLSGTAVISYVVGSGTCIVENQQTITIQQSGNPNWTNPGAICDQFTPINFNNFITGTSGGTWSGNGLAGPILFPEGLNGPILVTYTVGSGSCTSSLAQTLYIGATIPPISVQGGTNQQICNTSTVPPAITANGYQSTAVQWFSDAALTNLLSTGNVYNPTPSVNTTVYVSQTYAGCNASTATVNITFIEQPAPPSVTPSQVNFCPGSPLPLLTATSTNSTIVWFNDQALTQSLGSGTSFQPLESQAPDIWVVTGPATCRSTPTQVSLNGQQLSASWSAPGSLCSSAEPIDLATLVTGDAGGTFSGNGVTGTVFNPAGLNGNIVITYQVGSGSCIVESQQSINVLQGGDPSWTSPGSLCNATDPIVLSALVTGTAGGTWSGSGVAGTVFFPEGLNGSIQITYSVGSGQCASQLAQTITLISSVGAPVVPASITFCQGQVANPINAGVSPGASVTWYSDAALSNIIFEGNGFVPPANISTTYYVTQNVAACASTASTLAVAFSPAPSAPTTQSSIVFCQGQAIPELSATATGTITWYNNAGLTQVLGTGATYQPDNNVGTDIFVQTVEGNCASEAVEITLTEVLPVTADIAFEGNTTTCNFQPTVLLSPSSIGNLWSTGETTQAITISQAGNYTLTVTGTCNTANDEVTFIDNGVEASFTLTDNEGLAPFTATAVVTSSNADNSIFYLNGNAGSVTDNLPFTIQNEGSYTLSLVSTNAAGCIDSSSRVITVISGLLEVSIPNSFTPNGDGYNDLFKPVLKGLEEMNLIIFNRYGSQVASWKEGLINWDGSHSGAPSPDGVYFYVLQGKDYSGTGIERAGSITIVR